MSLVNTWMVVGFGDRRVGLERLLVTSRALPLPDSWSDRTFRMQGKVRRAIRGGRTRIALATWLF